MLKITYTKQARKALARMQPASASKIRAAIENLSENPAGLDIRKLTNRPGYRLRIGGWRIIYTADGAILAILRIAARGGVY